MKLKMVVHMLDGGQSKCSCRGWGCKLCNASNQLVQFHNDLMKFGLTKEKLKESLAFVKEQLNKIDSFTLYEYLSWEIDEEKYNEAKESFNPNKKKITVKKNEVDNFKPAPNPTTQHHFPSAGARVRCKFCNGIAKYVKNEPCPMYKGEENK